MAVRRVPLRTKLLYGVADIAINIKNGAINHFLLFFYADVVHLAPGIVGAMLFLGKLWDAVTDPIMGYISDTTRSRWGRRRPYVLVSALPMAICFYLLFSPPELSPSGLLGYVAAINVLLFTCFTLFAIPYMAWGAELTGDYHERTEVVQWRAIFGLVGGVAGAMVPALAHTRAEFSRIALVLSTVIALSVLITALTVSDAGRERLPGASLRHFLRGLRQTFDNRTFNVVFLTFSLMTVSAGIGQSLQLIVIKYWLGMYDFFKYIALTFGLSFALSFVLWLRLSRRFGKERALMIGLAMCCVVPFGWLVVRAGAYLTMLVFIAVAGVATGSITLAISQAVDVIDLDEIKTGERREGAYFGIWTLGLKTASAVGVLLGGFLLELAGYVPDEMPSPDTLWMLVLMVGPLQSAVYLVGLLVFRRVRTMEDVAKLHTELEARRSVARSI